MRKISFISVLILFVAYSSTNGQSTHYFDKYIEGVFKTIENPPAECLKLLKESSESKMLANKDLLMCYTLIENGIPQQLKFDILNHSPHEDRRAEEIKNKATFGTCYRKDSSSKYYAQLYTDLESKPNKTLEENLYLANINSHCTNLHRMHFVTDYVIVEREIQKKKRRRDTSSTIGVLIPTLYLAAIVYLIIVFRGV
jgi:hypothetical protein